MQDNKARYIAQPVIFPVGKKSKVSVIPLKGHLYFEDGKEYMVFVVPMCYNRKLPKAQPDLIVKAEGGMLTFEYEFEHECEYEIRFKDDPEKAYSHTCVYAVEEDLYGLRPLKGDLHVHTPRSDGDDYSGELASNFRHEGFDFIFVTDHNRYFSSEEVQDEFKGVKIDLNIMNGEEVHTPGSTLHIVHLCKGKGIDEYYCHHTEEYEKEVDEIEKEFAGIEDSRKLAMAKWATTRIHEDGGLAILPHPFWVQITETSTYNIVLPLLDKLFHSGWFDAYEINGGMTDNGNDLSISYFNQLRSEGFKMPLVSSSDAHKTFNDSKIRFGNIYTIVFAKDNTRDSIFEAIKNGMTSPVLHKVQDVESNHEYRVQGDFRLAMYTRFLIENYFERTKTLCRAEGILMREYTLGVEGAKETLESMSGRSYKLYRHFFGEHGESYYDIAEDKKRYDKYTQVWKDYGIYTRGAAIKQPK
ncbi:MAG: hypothetical protein IJN17_01205 [Clostridia bacterium]|nr:hypothetical protein [Clostridia bacterium]